MSVAGGPRPTKLVPVAVSRRTADRVSSSAAARGVSIAAVAREALDGWDPSDLDAQRVRRPSARPVVEGWPGLTQREVDVAALLARGYTGHEIADVLAISVKTVDTHRGHLLDKLGIRDEVALARHAIREGLVSGAADADSPGCGRRPTKHSTTAPDAPLPSASPSARAGRPRDPSASTGTPC